MFLKDIPFTPTWSEGAMATALKFFSKNNRRDFHSNTNFRIVSDDLSRTGKNDYEDWIGRVCHRGITDTRVSNRSLVATEIGTIRKGLKWTDGHDFFLNWFVNESFFGRWIVNKEDLDFIKNNGIVVSADVDTKIMQLTMIVSRHFSEIGEQSFKMFTHLVKDKGINPYLAFMCTFNTGLSTGANVLSAVTSVYSHRTFQMFRLRPLERFLMGEMVNGTGGKPYHYRYNADYNNGSQIFYDAKEPEDIVPAYTIVNKHFAIQLLEGNEDFKKALSTFRKKKVTGEHYRPPNPFTIAYTPPKPDQLSYEELYDFVLPWYMENIYDRSN